MSEHNLTSPTLNFESADHQSSPSPGDSASPGLPKPKLLDVDALMERIKLEVAQHQRSNRRFLGGNRINTTPLGVALSRMEMLLNTAETRAYQRTKWPDKLDRFPLNLSDRIKNAMLKMFNVIFKDQQEVNFSVIASLRESISLNRQLLSQLESLQLQMRSEMEIVLTALDELEQPQDLGDRPVMPIQAVADRQAKKERSQQLNEFYMALEDRFRGERSDIYDRLSVYLPLIDPGSLAIDLGCGRGEWLALLRDNHIQAIGIDTSERMVKTCENLKFKVLQTDILAYMATLANDSVGSVTGFHIMEHLPFDTVIQVFSETLRVLKPGGVAIFETPNPENVLVGSCNFYIDPTHRNPLPSSMVQFLAIEVGFVNTKIEYLHPNPGQIASDDLTAGPGKQVIDRFNHFFYGAQDYALIGYKQK
jgi:SAM-dependent methyltransferase